MNHELKSSSSSLLAVSSLLLTPVQLQRVNEIFHELYGYHFSSLDYHDGSNNDDDDGVTDGGDRHDHPNLHLKNISDHNDDDDDDAITRIRDRAGISTINNTDTTVPPHKQQPPPPKWLLQAMGNNRKYTQRIWNQLSIHRQYELLQLRWDVPTKITKKRIMYDTDHRISSIASTTATTTTTTDAASQRQLSLESSLVHSKKKRINHDLTNINIHSNTTPESTSNIPSKDLNSTCTTTTTLSTTSNTNNNPHPKSNLSLLVQQLHGTQKQVTTITKTAMDWEQYKDQNSIMKETLEQQTTSTTAYLPKQEFLQRVDQRKYQQEQQQRLLYEQQGKVKK